MIDIDKLDNKPEYKDWVELYKEFALVNLFKALCVNCKNPIKFKAYKIFAIAKKHGSDNYYYIITADENGKPEIIDNKYSTVRVAGSFPLLDENRKPLGSVGEKIKLLEKYPFYISASPNKNNVLRWVVVVLQNAQADE